MKIINYNYGPVLYPDSTHYRGKIIMTQDEWLEAYKYLTSAKVKKSFMPSYPWTNSQFITDAGDKRIINHGAFKGILIAIRVPMTEKLVEHFGLKGYKRNNYFIQITK